MMHPKFQIWREKSSQVVTYEPVHQIGGRASVYGNATSVYTYSASQSVQVGDFLGAYQPDDMKSKTFLSFQNYTGSPSYFLRQNSMSPPRSVDEVNTRMQGNFPLISVETSGWLLYPALA